MFCEEIDKAFAKHIHVKYKPETVVREKARGTEPAIAGSQKTPPPGPVHGSDPRRALNGCGRAKQQAALQVNPFQIHDDARLPTDQRP